MTTHQPTTYSRARDGDSVLFEHLDGGLTIEHHRHRMRPVDGGLNVLMCEHRYADGNPCRRTSAVGDIDWSTWSSRAYRRPA